MNKCLECGKETNYSNFCSAHCCGKYYAKKRRLESVKKYYKNPNYCLNCGNVIKVKKGRKLSETKRKKFCSHSCAASYNNSNGVKPKYCKNCGKELSGKKRNNIYCDGNCQREYKSKQYIKRWKTGKEDGAKGKHGSRISNYIKNYLLKKANYKCTRCGWAGINSYTGKTPLEVEHIDGNYKNNKPENLTILCPNCHSLTSTYKGANKGHGREYRYLLH